MIRSSFLVLSVLSLVILNSSLLSAQGYYGDADSLSCNCYRLTEAGVQFQGGFVWSNERIDLNSPFDYTFDVYLGADIPGQPSGADGIAFVLQPVGTNAGSSGGSMGYGGIAPSLAMSIDTYDNGAFDSDIVQDHVAIMANGSTDHASADNLAGPISALVSGINIEDGQWHVMRVSWNPATMVIDFYMDGSLRLSYTGDIIADIFLGDPLVYWGFTGATGTLTNLQQFCFSIIPGLSASDLSICEGETIDFNDDSYSTLGDVVAWNWDFGDGQTSSQQTPGEISFAQMGSYWVRQSIVDIQGCTASDSLQITVHPLPVADFTATQVCQEEETAFQSTSTGQVSSWQWNLGNGTTATGASTSIIYGMPGDYEVELAVESSYGCKDTVTATVSVFADPTAAATSSVAGFEGTFTAQLESGEEADWVIEGSSHTGENPFNYTFPDTGWYPITLVVTNANGCSATFQDSVHVKGIPDYTVPNVFTPDGNEMNERFRPETFAMTAADLQIFNRWGRPVFKYDGTIPANEPWGWDGTINGGPMADAGTYYYIMNLKGMDGVTYPEQGSVTLLR